MKIKSTWAMAMALGLGLTTAAIGAPRGSGLPGNSAVGRNQRTDLQTGSSNSSFGRTTAANARLRSDDLDDEDAVDRVNRTKTRKAKHTWSSYPGNSAFGRNQRINHLKGSGNNIHGKTVSANAKAKHGKTR